MVGGRAVMEAPPPMEEEVEYIYSHMEYIIQGVPKKRTFRMLLEPQCTGSITSSRNPFCRLEINFLVVSY